MKDFEQILSDVRDFQTEIDRHILDIIDANQKVVIDFNLAQLMAGQDAENDDIQPPYSPRYARYKRRRGLPVDRVNLRLEGDFYNSLLVKLGAREFTIQADDPKGKYLFARYGEQVLGLNDDHIDQLAVFIEPFLIQKAEEKILP